MDIKNLNLNIRREILQEFLQDFILRNNDLSYLDLGCGDNYLSQFGNVKGYDIQLEPFRFKEPIIYNGINLPEKACTFDVVISNNTIEHCEDPENHVFEIERVLKPNGIAIFFMPTPDDLHSRKWTLRHYYLLLRRGMNYSHGFQHENNARNESYSWSFEHYETMFTDMGLKVSYYETFGNVLSGEPRFNWFNQIFKQRNLRNGLQHFFILRKGETNGK